MRLLVVDDNHSIADFLVSVALDSGWTAEPATSEADFRRRFRAMPPDAIMLDLQLGASDGIEQLRFLHRHDYCGPVILISGFDARVLEMARQIGSSLGLQIAAVIEKPARAGRVRAALKQIEDSIDGAEDVERKPRGDTPSPAAAVSPAVIATAIHAGQMELYLQPIISADDSIIRRAEGLVRWHHPDEGMVPPDRFILIAEQDETVIDQLTFWVIKTAAEHYLELRKAGFEIQISVNVSGMNLHTLDFPDQVTALLDRASVPTGAIGLEITETSAMRDPAATADILTRLRLKGFSLAIDDFGTGHSSLEALRRMPFSTIKIDKGFIADLHSTRVSRNSLTILRSMIDLARSLGLPCVAEGIESEEVARRLVEMGVSGLQGYHFSRPLPLDQFADLLRIGCASGGTSSVDADTEDPAIESLQT